MTDKPDNNDAFLQNNPDDINDIESMKQKQKLPNDFGTPFSEPQGPEEPISKSAQQADTNIDSYQYYDESFSAAVEKKVKSANDIDDYDINGLYTQYDEIK